MSNSSPDDHEAIRQLVNNEPQDNFCGLTRNEMDRLTYDTYEPETPLRINQAIADEALDQLPFFRLTEELLKIIIRDGSIKLTPTGALPRKILEELYSHRLILEDWIESGLQKLSREIYSPALVTVRFNATLSGLVRKTKGRLFLTKKAVEILKEGNRNMLFRITFITYTEELPWGNLDRYPSLPIGSRGWGFTVFLLLRDGTLSHEAKYYASKYIQAFPDLLAAYPRSGFGSPERNLINCYGLRTFEQFLNWWGFVKRDKRRPLLERDQTKYTATTTLSEVFEFEELKLNIEPVGQLPPAQQNTYNEMPPLSADELTEYFARRNNRFVNLVGMEIISLKAEVFTRFTLFTDDNGPFKMEIVTTEEVLNDFIDGFRIKKLRDIDRLGYNDSWMRYLNGYAEILITPIDLEATFSFRIYKRRTIISSLELHFYDEAYKHLTLPEDFIEYFSSNERRVQTAVANRYKF